MSVLTAVQSLSLVSQPVNIKQCKRSEIRRITKVLNFVFLFVSDEVFRAMLA